MSLWMACFCYQMWFNGLFFVIICWIVANRYGSSVNFSSWYLTMSFIIAINYLFIIVTTITDLSDNLSKPPIDSCRESVEATTGTGKYTIITWNICSWDPKILCILKQMLLHKRLYLWILWTIFMQNNLLLNLGRNPLPLLRQFLSVVVACSSSLSVVS